MVLILFTSLPAVFDQETDEHIGVNKVWTLSLWIVSQVGFLKWQQFESALDLLNSTSNDLL